ncbi:MAG: GntR family transcriptional regulator [Victivallales bacterium]|nr:GntR family transcriptional regulator [Victivallales bacterium]
MTVSENAYKQIKKMIISGKLPAGEKVSQLKLSRILNCSPVPIVEAMRRLESEGFILKKSRKMAIIRKFTMEEMNGLYLVREGLESVSARLCAKNITDKQILQLRRLSRQYETAIQNNDVSALHSLEVDIHLAIVRDTGCSFILEELERLFLIEKTILANTKPVLATAYYSHQAIIEAIANHDEDGAEYLMKKHIQNGFQEFLQVLQQNPSYTND